MTFVDCPAFVDEDMTQRCALPAAIEVTWTVYTTDGPMKCAKVVCPLGHWFNGDIRTLTLPFHL